MKRNFILTALLSLALAVVTGCGPRATIHKPTMPEQVGTSAVIAYAVAGFAAGQYFAYPLCTQPLTVVPCKTQAINDSLRKANKIAYDAAKAADAAVDDATKRSEAAAKLEDLNKANSEAKKASNGGAP